MIGLFQGNICEFIPVESGDLCSRLIATNSTNLLRNGLIGAITNAFTYIIGNQKIYEAGVVAEGDAANNSNNSYSFSNLVSYMNNLDHLNIISSNF
jgi:hypothetical protein